MWSCGRHVWVASAAKDSKVNIGRLSAIKGKKRSEAIKSPGGVRIEEVSGSVKRVSPIDREGTGLKQKGTHNVVDRAKGAFGATILL